MTGEYDLPIYEHKDGLSVVPPAWISRPFETELINEAGRGTYLSPPYQGAKRRNSIISLIDCPPLSLLTLNALTARIG